MPKIPPNSEAIRLAREFIIQMKRNGQPPTRIAPSVVGGIGVTKRVGDRMAYVEFYNSGKVYALLTDDHTDGCVIEVFPEEYPSLLVQIKDYLNGG